MQSKKMYVLVRKDIGDTLVYPGVQAGHALAEYLIKYPDCEWKNGYLIYLCVKNEEELKRWEFKLQNRDIPFTTFKEPDINNQLTALAVYSTDIFGSLQTL